MIENTYQAIERARAERRRKRQQRRKREWLVLIGVVICLFVVLLVVSLRKPAQPPKDNIDNPLQIAYNRTPQSRSKNDIRYIVIHDTANKEKNADAKSHYDFFNSGAQGMSADFFVDDEEILQVNNYYQYYTWHCGDGSAQNEITNMNSIGVEICVNRDGNYEKAVDNAVLLVRKLMHELSIDASCVVRHYDASGKECPASMSAHGWKKWEQLKKKIMEMPTQRTEE
ncbi:MAG: hypothetical protein E7418_00245 [Ruminococcaceae bacterium]|nr:hypothetical protein [Oscillospiraceae bacterium]